jgi:hypothetical protein
MPTEIHSNLTSSFVIYFELRLKVPKRASVVHLNNVRTVERVQIDCQ